jgi:hypothetical protein
MALFRKGIYEIRKKLILTEKEVYKHLNKNFGWSYKHVVSMLYLREFKIAKSKHESNYDLIDFRVFIHADEICKKVQISKPTLLKWVKHSDAIETMGIETETLKVDLISFHTFLQKCFEHQAKYSDRFIDGQFD